MCNQRVPGHGERPWSQKINSTALVDPWPLHVFSYTGLVKDMRTLPPTHTCEYIAEDTL